MVFHTIIKFCRDFQFTQSLIEEANKLNDPEIMLKILFLKAVKALKNKRADEALQIIQENCSKGLVTAQQRRTGYIDDCFEYRYHPQPQIGYTLLHYAVLYNQVEIIKLLIANDASEFISYMKYLRSYPGGCFLAFNAWRRST